MGLVERAIESIIVRSRWLMAPFYIGLIVSLAVLLIKFFLELVHFSTQVISGSESDIILGVLSLIDLALTGNLVLIVIFSGYENFVSKIDVAGHEDRPSWMGTLDFSGLKIKLVGSIVAISAISLLRAFMTITQSNTVDQTLVLWLVILHVTFVTSGVLFAVMDWVASLAGKHGHGHARAENKG